MPSGPPECLRCDTPMVRGFLLDNMNKAYRGVQRWVEGDPQFSFWKGVSLEDREPINVTTYRCPTCGCLESYAFTDLPL